MDSRSLAPLGLQGFKSNPNPRGGTWPEFGIEIRLGMTMVFLRPAMRGISVLWTRDTSLVMVPWGTLLVIGHEIPSVSVRYNPIVHPSAGLWMLGLSAACLSPVFSTSENLVGVLACVPCGRSGNANGSHPPQIVLHIFEGVRTPSKRYRRPPKAPYKSQQVTREDGTPSRHTIQIGLTQ